MLSSTTWWVSAVTSVRAHWPSCSRGGSGRLVVYPGVQGVHIPEGSMATILYPAYTQGGIPTRIPLFLHTQGGSIPTRIPLPSYTQEGVYPPGSLSYIYREEYTHQDASLSHTQEGEYPPRCLSLPYTEGSIPTRMPLSHTQGEVYPPGCLSHTHTQGGVYPPGCLFFLSLRRRYTLGACLPFFLRRRYTLGCVASPLS